MHFTLRVTSGGKKEERKRPKASLKNREKNALNIFQLLVLSVFAQLMY